MNPYLKQFNLKINVARKQKLGKLWNFQQTALHSNRSTYTRIYMPVSGDGEIGFRNFKLHLEPGYIYLIPPYVELSASCSGYLEKYWIHFNAYIFNSELDIFSVFKTEYKMKVENSDFYERLFDRVIEQHYMPVLERKLRVGPLELKLAEAALLLLLEPFLRNMESSVDGQREAALLRMVKITSFIEENLDKTIKLSDLARIVNLNPTYMSNLFTSLIGVSPICYYNQQRIERAKKLLGNTNLRISEIASRCGAESLDSFYKLFLRHIGMSPTEYREKIQTEE